MKYTYSTIMDFCFKRAHTTCFIDKCCGADWGACSKMHDRRYENKRLTRKQADILFYRCVRRRTSKVWGEHVATAFAKTLYTAVRWFGWTRYGKK